MRPADYAALWKYFSFCLVVSVLCYVGYLQTAQNHLDLLHARLWAEAVCDPGVAQLNYIIWGCASCWPCVVSCLPFLWPCPPAAVWEFCCLPFPRLDVCARVFAILNQKCTMCASDETAWKESSVLRQFSGLTSRLKIGYCPNLDKFLWILTADLFASPHRDLPDKKLVIWLGEGRRAVWNLLVEDCFFSTSLWPALFFAEEISKGNGLKLLKEFRLEVLL